MMQSERCCALELIGISKSFSDGARQRMLFELVDLTVGAGEVVALMGASGSGKSTLLAIAGGLEVADEGVVRVAGAQLSGSSAAVRSEVRRRSIGFVFQDFNLLSALSALDNVALAMELDGLKRREATCRAEETLELLGLGDVKSRMPSSLSGGERQRVAIARATSGQKNLVLADEPTGSLDAASSDAVLRLLQTVATMGAGVLVVTHDTSVATQASRVVRLADGTLSPSGPAAEKAQCAH